MMVHSLSRNCCSVLGVVCGQNTFHKKNQFLFDYPVSELVSSGFLQVQVLDNPSLDEFRQTLQSVEADILYLQGEQIDDGETTEFPRWADANSLSPEGLCGLFGSRLPSTVYLEFPDSKKLAEALHSKGVPYVIFWRSSFSLHAALHFRQALFSVIQSSPCHIFDAFQLARASFCLYCMRETIVTSDNEQGSSKVGPHILGEPPIIDVSVPKSEDQDDEENVSEYVAAVKVYDDDVSLKFLVCGLPSTMDASLLSSLEDGLNALLNIEIRGSKLFNRTSAPTPALQAGAITRGIVTMRCDISTCSSSYVSLLVSGNADTCFSDQLLENHIKNELIEREKIVNVSSSSEEHKGPLVEPRKSASIACGANVSEVCVKVPMWASQVLRQLAVDVSYRSLVMLGIASIQGLSIASFEKDDAKRLIFFYKQDNQFTEKNGVPMKPPIWFVPPPPSDKRSEPWEGTKTPACNGLVGKNGVNFKRGLNVASMRPIPHTRRHKILPVSALFPVPENHNGDQVKHNVSIPPAKHTLPTPITNRKSQSGSHQAKLIASLNSIPLKKHGCSRAPIQACSEEEFLRDVMQFLILRGHNRLVPRGGLAEFPDAILNATRLDLFNLYREVVSRGGFNVGNGINWKGQVFSKMRNHTLTNRMTGVGNTLKRHYETYLLEYELAHDDVDGECCLLCKSSAAGDWVNCGICDEWAHFGCDRRQGLGAFKDYSKTDGLEYICPKCSSTNIKKKSQRSVDNGFSSKSQRLF